MVCYVMLQRTWKSIVFIELNPIHTLSLFPALSLLFLQQQTVKLKNENYVPAYIDSLECSVWYHRMFSGSVSYRDLYIPKRSSVEVTFISTHQFFFFSYFRNTHTLLRCNIYTAQYSSQCRRHCTHFPQHVDSQLHVFPPRGSTCNLQIYTNYIDICNDQIRNTNRWL